MRSPTAGSCKVTVQSGWVMEDCWHHMETFFLLTAGPLFEEALEKAIMTEKELASPTVMRSVSQLAVLGHMYKRLQGAAWFVTRWGLQNVGNGFVSLLISNLHSAVCRMICQMLACGHPLAELWMENLVGFLKAGAKRVLPKTMMRDLLFAQQIHRMKAHRLYREPNPNKKGYMAPDGAGPGAVETPIRLRWRWGLLAYKAASLRNGNKPWLHRGRGGEDGETSRDIFFFVYKMLKQVPDADSPPYTSEELECEEELPRNLLAEREDAKYTTMVARAQHFYLATPPPPPGADSDDSCVSARPIRAALYGPGIRKVAVLMAPAHMSSAKAADLGVDAGELLVAGIHARSQDVRAKCKCKLLVAGIHARSQDGAGLGVCRRQSCKAMDTVRDAKSG
eukprot:jgi/Tetstr1/464738/TSEL_009485.t1